MDTQVGEMSEYRCAVDGRKCGGVCAKHNLRYAVKHFPKKDAGKIFLCPAAYPARIRHG